MNTIHQHYFTSFVDALLSTALHSLLAFALSFSIIVENYQIKFPLSEDNQLKSIPEDITTKNYFACSVMWLGKIQLNSQGQVIDFLGPARFEGEQN